MTESSWTLGPSVYWFWSKIPTQAEIERQVGEIAQAGYRSFLPQGRLSLPLAQYLSPEYLRAYRQAVEAAARHNLVVGIYDDYNWMSGHAGGRTVAANPEVRERHLFWSSSLVQDGKADCTVSEIHSLMYEGWSPAAMNWAYQDGKIDWGNWQLFKVLAYATEPQPGPVQVVDVTPYASLEGDAKGCKIRVEMPDGALQGWRVTAWVSAQCLTSRMINYLDPQAAQTFIQVGLEPFRQAVGDYFGTTVRYQFFDHPYCGFYTWKEHHGAIGNSLMFTPQLGDAFQQAHGYPLEQALLAFIQENGENTVQRRCDFFETYGELGRSSYFGAIRRWAEANGLLLAGHELLAFVGAWGLTDGFASLDARTNFGGDYFHIDRYKDLSAVDACNYAPQLSPTFGASVAKANGKRGCMIEQYAVASNPNFSSAIGNWGLSLGTVRRQALRFLFQGASHFIFHAFYLTDGEPDRFDPLGNQRFDFPPGINFEPWFHHHPAFAAEYQRLDDWMQQAQSADNPVAILYSLRTYWAEDDAQEFSQAAGAWFQRLAKAGIGYDIVDERQIEGQELCYPWLILPSVSVLRSRSSLERLNRFMDHGGRIISSGRRLRATQADGELTDAELKRFYERKEHIVLSSPVAPDDILLDQIKETSGGPYLIAPQSDTAPIWFQRIPTADGYRVLLLNDSDRPRRASFACPGTWSVEQVNLASGSTSLYPFQNVQSELTVVIADLLPGEVRAFVLSPGASAGPRLTASTHFVTEVIVEEADLQLDLAPGTAEAELEIQAKSAPTRVVGDGWQELTASAKEGESCWSIRGSQDARIASRCLAGPWQLEAGGQTWNDLPDLSRSWEEMGLAGYKGEGVYRTTIHLDETEAQIRWSLEWPDYADPVVVLVNGQPVGEVVIEARQVRIPVGVLHTGDNTLELHVQNSADSFYYHNTPYEALIQNTTGKVGQVMLHPVYRVVCEF